MKNTDLVKRVVALFDKEDVEYIKSSYYKEQTKEDDKVKKIGGLNDGLRKRKEME